MAASLRQLLKISLESEGNISKEIDEETNYDADSELLGELEHALSVECAELSEVLNTAGQLGALADVNQDILDAGVATPATAVLMQQSMESILQRLGGDLAQFGLESVSLENVTGYHEIAMEGITEVLGKLKDRAVEIIKKKGESIADFFRTSDGILKKYEAELGNVKNAYGDFKALGVNETIVITNSMVKKVFGTAGEPSELLRHDIAMTVNVTGPYLESVKNYLSTLGKLFREHKAKEDPDLGKFIAQLEKIKQPVSTIKTEYLEKPFLGGGMLVRESQQLKGLSLSLNHVGWSTRSPAPSTSGELEINSAKLGSMLKEIDTGLQCARKINAAGNAIVESWDAFEVAFEDFVKGLAKGPMGLADGSGVVTDQSVGVAVVSGIGHAINKHVQDKRRMEQGYTKEAVARLDSLVMLPWYVYELAEEPFYGVLMHLSKTVRATAMIMREAVKRAEALKKAD